MEAKLLLLLKACTCGCKAHQLVSDIDKVLKYVVPADCCAVGGLGMVKQSECFAKQGARLWCRRCYWGAASA